MRKAWVAAAAAGFPLSAVPPSAGSERFDELVRFGSGPGSERVSDMAAPDDWAEIYVRPRDELSPTRAFRLSSWSTALGGGDFTVTEVPPPREVTR